jgi:uncharacterized protein
VTNAPAPGRDRDLGGRPRNARPRDALGRPLPRSAAGEPAIEDTALPGPEALRVAQRLIDDARPFHAHEVLELAWKAAAPAERDFWQGLAQLAVGLTHARRGNAAGAVALLRRGSSRLSGYAGARPHGVDVAGLCAAAAALAEQIENDGLLRLQGAELRLTLISPGPAA